MARADFAVSAGMNVSTWMAYLAGMAGIVLTLLVLAVGWTRPPEKLETRGRYHGRHVKPGRARKGSPLHLGPQSSSCCSGTAGGAPRRREEDTGACVVPGGCPAIVRAMHGDFDLGAQLYRLMPPRRRPGASGDLGEALDAARVTRSELREALDAARGTAPAEADPISDPSWPDARPPRHRRWARHLGRALGRVDVWILIVGIAGLVIAYLTLVKH